MLCAARPAAESAAGTAADLEPPAVRPIKTLTGRGAQPPVPARRQGHSTRSQGSARGATCMSTRAIGAPAICGPPAALISVRPTSAAGTVHGRPPALPGTLWQDHLHMLCAARPAAESAAGTAADLEPPAVRPIKTLTGKGAQPPVPARRQGHSTRSQGSARGATCMSTRAIGAPAICGPPAALISVRPTSAAGTVHGRPPALPGTLWQDHLHMLCAARPAAESAAGTAADLEPPAVRPIKTLTGKGAQPPVPARRQGHSTRSQGSVSCRHCCWLSTPRCAAGALNEDPHRRRSTAAVACAMSGTPYHVTGFSLWCGVLHVSAQVASLPYSGPPAALICVRPTSAAGMVHGRPPTSPVTLPQHHLHMLFAA